VASGLGPNPPGHGRPPRTWPDGRSAGCSQGSDEGAERVPALASRIFLGKEVGDRFWPAPRRGRSPSALLPG